jgi:hypothetical protein
MFGEVAWDAEPLKVASVVSASPRKRNNVIQMAFAAQLAWAQRASVALHAANVWISEALKVPPAFSFLALRRLDISLVRSGLASCQAFTCAL